jgi:hypothetical protein
MFEESTSCTTQTQPTKKDHGFLIRIKDKKTERHPDFEGELPIAGKKYLLAGWVRISKKGNKYLSLSVRPHPDQDQDRNGSPAASLKPEPQEAEPDEIPF